MVQTFWGSLRVLNWECDRTGEGLSWEKVGSCSCGQKGQGESSSEHERETLKMEDGYSQEPWAIFKDEHRLVLAERSLTRLLMLTEVSEKD